MSDPLPNKRLFLYATFEDAKKIAKTGKIRLSLPSKTNDTTECVVKGETEQRDEIENYGYICLSGNCTSPAMWGYYAGKSTGVCFVFDIPTNASEEKMEHGVLLSKPSKSTLCKVKYSEDKSESNKETNQILATKSPDWQHEYEYRIIFKTIKNQNLKSEVDEKDEMAFYEPSEMWELCSGAILGANCPETIAQFQARMRQEQVVIKAKENPDKFSFEVEQDKIPEKYYDAKGRLVIDEYDQPDRNRAYVNSMLSI